MNYSEGDKNITSTCDLQDFCSICDEKNIILTFPPHSIITLLKITDKKRVRKTLCILGVRNNTSHVVVKHNTVNSKVANNMDWSSPICIAFPTYHIP